MTLWVLYGFAALSLVTDVHLYRKDKKRCLDGMYAKYLIFDARMEILWIALYVIGAIATAAYFRFDPRDHSREEVAAAMVWSFAMAGPKIVRGVANYRRLKRAIPEAQVREVMDS